MGTIRRLREILLDAPWSSYDLLSSAIVAGIGVYLFLVPNLFQHVGGVYAPFAAVAGERVWGGLYLACGVVGIGNTLWCERPAFGFWLLSRIGVAFCLLCFALNNLLYQPPPLSSVTYGLLSVLALWGVARTKSSGR